MVYGNVYTKQKPALAGEFHRDVPALFIIKTKVKVRIGGVAGVSA